jgi:hypothetical protein
MSQRGGNIRSVRTLNLAMTMPIERTRSLRWGFELLTTLADDNEVPIDLRERAQLLMTTYPSPEQVTQLISSNSAALPTGVGVAIEQARELFTDVQLTCRGAATTRRDLQFTLRHFPLPGHAESRERGFPGGIEFWIDLETP